MPEVEVTSRFERTLWHIHFSDASSVGARLRRPWLTQYESNHSGHETPEWPSASRRLFSGSDCPNHSFVWPPNGTNPEPTRHHGPGAMPAATLCACDSVIVNRGSGCGTTRTKASRDSTGRDAIVDCLVRWRHRCNGTTGTHTPTSVASGSLPAPRWRKTRPYSTNHGSG